MHSEKGEVFTFFPYPKRQFNMGQSFLPIAQNLMRHNPANDDKFAEEKVEESKIGF